MRDLIAFTPSFLLITCGLALAGAYITLGIYERHLQAMRFCEAIALFCVCFVAAIYAIPATPSHYVLRAISASGDVYIAGSGDTCNQAYRAAIYPDNVRSVSCDRD